MARLLPRVRVLDGARHLGDAVERHRHDTARHRAEPLEAGGEHEGRAEHEHEEQEVDGVQVLERHLGGHDAFHVLVRLKARLQVMVDVERAALAHVSQPPVPLHDGLHAPHHHVGSVLGVHVGELVALALVEQRRQRRRAVHVVAKKRCLRGANSAPLRVPVPALAHGLAHEREQHVGQTPQLHAVAVERFVETRRLESVGKTLESISASRRSRRSRPPRFLRGVRA